MAVRKQVILLPAGTFEGRGPKMQALRPRQRRFVMAIVASGGTNHSAAAVAAGYSGDENTLAVTAHRLMHTPAVMDAIREESEKRLNSSTLLATSVLMEIATDKFNKDRLKAAVEILNRSGFHAKTEHTVHVNDPRTEKELLEKITLLAAQLGLDPKMLIEGPKRTAIDAEFSEVVTGTEGLEDVL